MQKQQPAFEVKNLSVEFFFDGQRQRALRGLSYSVAQGETVAVVGESGSGKTVQALAALGLLPEQARISSGEIIFDGRDLLKATTDELRAVRGAGIAMVFQDPMTSLNPALTVCYQIIEAFKTKDSPQEQRRKAAVLLALTGIREPEKRLNQYPHQLSGGLRQRVLLAIAIACEPQVLIADEPTTALDVTVQAQLIAQLKRLQNEKKMALVMITHNMGIVGQLAERVVVVYAGCAMEKGPVSLVLEKPLHPYTKALLESVPPLYSQKERLDAITGQPPKPGETTPGCPFAPRCPRAWEKCSEEEPPEFQPEPGRSCKCWLHKT